MARNKEKLSVIREMVEEVTIRRNGNGFGDVVRDELELGFK